MPVLVGLEVDDVAEPLEALTAAVARSGVPPSSSSTTSSRPISSASSRLYECGADDFARARARLTLDDWISEPDRSPGGQGFLAPKPDGKPVDHCFRCGVETPAGVGLCDEHNRGHLSGPSSTQMHATIFGGIVLGVIAFFLLASLAVRPRAALRLRRSPAQRRCPTAA